MCYILAIDTTKKDTIYIALKKNVSVINEKTITARRKQAEVLLIEIDKLLKKQKLNKKNLKKIKVANNGGSFTSLRIGVITANTLGYALGIPVLIMNNVKYKKEIFNVVKPIYQEK